MRILLIEEEAALIKIISIKNKIKNFKNHKMIQLIMIKNYLAKNWLNIIQKSLNNKIFKEFRIGKKMHKKVRKCKKLIKTN